MRNRQQLINELFNNMNFIYGHLGHPIGKVNDQVPVWNTMSDEELRNELALSESFIDDIGME